MTYAGNEVSETSAVLSVEEEISNAKERARKPIQERIRVSSKCTIIVRVGEGRATREIEII